MIAFQHTEVVGWEAAIRGMRNAWESWDKSDSTPCNYPNRCVPECRRYTCTVGDHYYVGPNDLDLMTRLRNAGADHRKFMRMIAVYVDITAPLYWWKEFDTYKVGTVANSCSTMHTIHKKEFTPDDFSHEYLDWTDSPEECYEAGDILDLIVKQLNVARSRYDIANDRPRNADLSISERKHILAQRKRYWYTMIQLLPSSYNQKRTVMLNYEVLANIYKSRRDHKLDEWREFCCWIEELPYSELIMGSKKLPSAEEIAVLFEEVKKLDTRVATYEVHELRRMQLLELFDKSGVALWSFVLNKYSLVEILDQVKRGLEILGNLEINVTNNVSTNLLEFGV